jgi:TonB-dependent starch-binding outer membrane protein SusC
MKQKVRYKALYQLIARSMLVLLLSFVALSSFAQEHTISGVITDESGGTLPGVNVIIKGTTTGTVSDLDGKFSIKVPGNEAILSFSFVGYTGQEIQVGTQTSINVTLKEEVKQLNEVVVIGYGTQKKVLNTGANFSISGDKIQALNTSTTMDALKGISPGLTITQNSGQPGSGTKVYIRGIGTNGSAAPLFIVDGVQVPNIDFLSSADIESISTLRDAASAAIYGSRAANGVILVTTKKGTIGGKTTIIYDGYLGWQNVAKAPELLNAKQYMDIMTEAYANSKMSSALDFADNVPDYSKIENGTWNGTNWFDLFTDKNAPVQSHTLSITGGSKNSSFAFSGAYLDQVGILGPQVNNAYKRMNLRFNSEHILFEKAGRDVLKFGENLTYINTHTPTIRTGSIYWSDVHDMMVASPLLPMYADSINDPAYPYHNAIAQNTSEGNPIANAINNDAYNYNYDNTIIGNLYFELQPIKNLTLRSSVGGNSDYGATRQWIPIITLAGIGNTTQDQITQKMYNNFTWTMTNTVSYNFKIGSHDISAMVGNEVIKNTDSLYIQAHNENSLFGDALHGYISNTQVLSAANNSAMSSKDQYGWGMESYFGRISYDFKETYLLTLVLRTDGSSKFAQGHQWGTFPSVSAGWVATNESFMEGTKDWLSLLKVRGSWGQNGNQNIPNFQYLATISYDNANYFFGPDKSVKTIGSYPPILPNPNISWETSESTDLGADVNFFKNRLQYTFDWYKKDTRGWLVTAPNPASYGTGAPVINGGTISNKGIEMFLRWNDNIGKLNYGVSLSYTLNKNEITAIANSEGIIHGPANVLSQGTSEMYRAQVGYPIGYFWGYKTAGLFQDTAQVSHYTYTNPTTGKTNKIESWAKPGDVIFVDLNHDGIINDKDKTQIGDPNPHFIYGIQLNADYKGIYVQITTNGQGGNQIAKSYRSFNDSPQQNYTTDVFNRWHGPGTSNSMPRLTASSSNSTMYISDLYIENGDFLRISNITIGYDLKSLIKKMPFSQFRIYYTGKNLFTFTKYSGLDPEVGYAPDNWSSGIDLGFYPQSKTNLIGLSITF